MYLSVVGDSCSIMSNNYELIMDYDMIIILGQCWFQIDKYDSLDILNMWLTCVNSCTIHAWYYLDKVIDDVFI